MVCRLNRENVARKRVQAKVGVRALRLASGQTTPIHFNYSEPREACLKRRLDLWYLFRFIH